DVRDRLAIFRESDAVGGESGEKWHECGRLDVIARQLAARESTHNKQLLRVLTGQRRAEGHRARSQLDGRLGVDPTEPTPLLGNTPNISLGLEDEIFAVGTPFSATFARGIVPARQ